MLVISWNTWGLGGMRRRTTLRCLILRCKPNVHFLRLMKLPSVDWPFRLCFSPSSSLSRGLLTLWDLSVFMGHTLDLNFRSISVIFSGPANLLWCLSNFLKSLSSTISRAGVPWCGVGDFNMVRGTHEVLTLSVLSSTMALFDDFITHHGLLDFEIVGTRFTWSNNSASVLKLSKLDRFLV
ncbi:hypothetical protein AMTRI_Chr11g151560 [Amborella trichopoda]